MQSGGRSYWLDHLGCKLVKMEHTEAKVSWQNLDLDFTCRDTLVPRQLQQLYHTTAAMQDT